MKINIKSIKSWEDVTKAFIQVGSAMKAFNQICFNLPPEPPEPFNVACVSDQLTK